MSRTIEAQKLMNLRRETEPERLDRIAREAGFISYADYEEQLHQISQLVRFSTSGGQAIPVEKQPTFWTELL